MSWMIKLMFLYADSKQKYSICWVLSASSLQRLPYSVWKGYQEKIWSLWSRWDQVKWSLPWICCCCFWGWGASIIMDFPSLRLIFSIKLSIMNRRGEWVYNSWPDLVNFLHKKKLSKVWVGFAAHNNIFCRWFPLSSLRIGIQKALLDQYDLLVEPLNKVNSGLQSMPYFLESVNDYRTPVVAWWPLPTITAGGKGQACNY